MTWTRRWCLVAGLLLAGCGKDAPSAPAEPHPEQSEPVEQVEPVEQEPEAPARGRPPLDNGSFEAAGDGIPGWTLALGATQKGDGSTSTARVVTSDASDRGMVLELSGDAATTRWRMASQEVAVPRERSQLVVTFSQRALGVRRDPGQFQNANVVVAAFDGAGKRLALAGTPPVTGDTGWLPGRLRMDLPAGTAKATVSAFLSMSGRLRFDDVEAALRPLRPWRREDSGAAWDALVEEVAAVYPFEDVAEGVATWNRRAAELRPAAVAAPTRDDFVATLIALLKPLDDPHVVIDVAGTKQATAKAVNLPKLWRFESVKARIAEQLFGRGAFAVARLKSGLGYVLIGSWIDAPVDELVAAIAKLRDAPGIIVDVRPNQGGDERLARRVASLFAAEPTVYARHRYRAGDGYGPWEERVLQPAAGQPYEGKVAVLQSPWCMSSSEGFLMMMAALRTVTTVGQPTRGATSNPAPVSLTADVTATVSRWQASLPDGTLVERRGLAPDVAVEASAADFESADPTLERAIALLR